MPALADSFAPIRLYRDDIVEGTRGGPEFSTDISINHGGYEQRNANWVYPLGRWELGQRGYCESTKEYLQSFFRQRRGRFQAFLWRDLADWQASSTPVVSEGGFSTQGWLVPQALGGARLVKRYNDGSYSAERIISEPILSSLSLPAGATWDANTQTVLNAPAIEQPISFDFDVPVRFDTDRLELDLLDTEGHAGEDSFEAIWNVGSLPIVEVRRRSGEVSAGGSTRSAVLAWGQYVNTPDNFLPNNAGTVEAYNLSTRLYFSLVQGNPLSLNVALANSTFTSVVVSSEPQAQFDPSGSDLIFAWDANMNLGCVFVPGGSGTTANWPAGSADIVVSSSAVALGKLSFTITDGGSPLGYDLAQWLAYSPS